MTSRERVAKSLRHEEPDRVPIMDGPWKATINRWRKEGFPEDIPPEEYFDYEIAGFMPDFSPRFPVKILEKNEGYIAETTPYGGVRKNFRDYSTTPEVIECPIKTKKDWEKIKERLKAEYTRVDWVTGLQENQKKYETGKFTVYVAPTGYDHFQQYLKSQDLLEAMVTEPEWVREMFGVHAELVIGMAKLMIKEGFHFDGAMLLNDMGYRNASLFSPKTYKEVILESDRMMCDFFHSQKMPVILHSCGNVKELIPHLINAGFDCLQPLEVKAGMDLIELKRLYGDNLAFMGGIDVRLMSDAKLIEEEIKTKFAMAKKGGGYIYHSDHSIPSNISFSQYKYVMELVRRYGRYDS